MKHIVFINPPNVPVTEKSISIEPIDILQLATYVRDLGNNVTLLDLDINHGTPREHRVHEHIIKYKPDIAVCLFDYHIPLHLETTCKNIHTIGLICKQYSCKIVVGGKMATYMPQKFIFPKSAIDIAIRYDMESPLKQILEDDKWDNKTLHTIDNIAYLVNNKLHCTVFGKKPVDVCKLPIPDRGLISLDEHIDVRTMLTSRGCMMKCSFCHVPGFRGKWQGRSVQQVVDEMEYLVESCKTKKILFLDDNATVDTKRIEAVCTEIMARNLHVARGCLSTIHSFSPKLMKTMYESGCRRIHYGIESADSTISKNIHKFLDEEKITAAVEQTKAVGIRVRTSRIMDLPGTTEDSLQRTLGLMEKLESDEIRIHFLANRLGSELYHEPDEIITTQYIHHNAPTQSKAEISSVTVVGLVQSFIQRMRIKGYTIIDSIEKNTIFESQGDAPVRCISLCPLRYGINR